VKLTNAPPSWRMIVALSALSVSAFAPPVAASEKPPVSGPARAASLDETDWMLALTALPLGIGDVGARAGERPRDLGDPVSPPLELRAVSPAAAAEKADTFTDAGFGLAPAPLTALEESKFRLARAAIEASRRAGTLERAEPVDPATVPSPEDWEAIKRQALEATPAVTLAPDPAAGVGVETAPPEAAGPAPMTPEEREKLERLRAAGGDPSAESGQSAPAPAAERKTSGEASSMKKGGGR